MARYLSLAEFWYLARHVTSIDIATLIKASRVDLADSALQALQAGFDDTDFYPDLHDKAAELARRIACLSREDLGSEASRGEQNAATAATLTS